MSHHYSGPETLDFPTATPAWISPICMLSRSLGMLVSRS
jgi:hypothetical protein